ncbi:MAG: hypothetical protein CMA72_06040 [Euryarchaeota archaeon]|nr:hypothetical protein [Euryarchaeota archaeon]|tara:strand:+ start:6943 stop:7344 length:402 start_codon:yes stop_codon:yes gene_type:complete
MAKFRGVEVVKQIDEALDKGLARFLINTQSKLSAASPVKFGRLASGWFIGKGVADRTEPPKRKSAGPVVITKYSGEIKMDSGWWISNSLPYAYRAAFDPYQGRRGGGDWFTAIENNLAKDVQRSFDFFLRKVK